jgi:hypothetical protein
MIWLVSRARDGVCLLNWQLNGGFRRPRSGPDPARGRRAGGAHQAGTALGWPGGGLPDVML